MANYNVNLVMCPFNSSHMIDRPRLDFHIAKCKQKHNIDGKIVCKFDTTHWHLPTEMHKHLENCPSRSRFDMEQYSISTDEPILPVAPSVLPDPSTALWDDEPPTPTYNPQEALQSRPVYNMIRGATRSERVRHRFNEGLRFSEIAYQNQQQNNDNYQNNGYNNHQNNGYNNSYQNNGYNNRRN